MFGLHNKVRPFRFWSQKVLPLVYDDSLSYYEVLCKLTGKLNEVIDFVNDRIVDVIKEQIGSYVASILYRESDETIVFNFDEE